jgi:potassium efflux system protein
VGLLLRRQRSDAPDVGKYQRFIRMRQDLIRGVQLQQLELQEERRELANLDRTVGNALTRLGGSVPAEEQPQIEALLRELLQTRRDYLDELISDHETYFQKLVDFDARQLELIGKTEELLLYIDERVLWMPSGSVVRPGLASDGLAALQWLLGPRYWGQLFRAALNALLATPLLNGSVLLLLLAAWPIARRVRPRIETLGRAARDPGCTRFVLTWEALALSLVLVPWLPGLLGYLGWRIGVSPSATQFARCFAYGMGAAALFWITVQVPRELLRRDGLAEAHFGWDPDAVASLHRWLGWLLAVAVPGVLLIYVFELRDEAAWNESIGLLLFVALMLVAAVFTHAGMREGGPLERIVRSGFPMSGWLWRVAHYAALGAPILLALAAVRGFYWTALRLAARHHFTLVLVLGLIVVFALALRWSKLARARAAEELQRERERLRAVQAAAGDAQQLAEPLEPQLDLAAADLQIGRLLKSGALLTLLAACWLIWADVLPAAGILREVELWDATQTVTVEAVDAAGETRLSSEEQIVPITLADLFQALLIGLVTLVVARNLAGLVEIALPRSIGMGSGERYAFATIAKYGATLLGAALAFRVLGAGWSNIQWLVAAVGLGLGFGLQEIFANFVSGLIILFERPIRVGDTVTVGDVSGTVTRIRIRATWITGFDRKELVVPNKEFVTGRLVNWSLSDPILRVEIPVGIAYGSDTELALRVLRRVAAENRDVLKAPEPQVLFLGFGDSSLNFELRVFSPDVARWLRIRHELHMAIDRAFRAEGIEIAFPQRDLHLRSLPESALLALAERGELPGTPGAS